jgi:hypothetical protein
MEKTYLNYKGKRYEIEEYRLQTRLIEGQEMRLIHIKFRGKEFEADTLPKVRGWLEKIIAEEEK